MSRATWAVAFFMIALLSVAALAVFWFMRPRELDGDLRA
jgi:predicted MFS family arabinose efflux permease